MKFPKFIHQIKPQKYCIKKEENKIHIMNILLHDINESMSRIQKLNTQKTDVNHEKSNILMYHGIPFTLDT